MNPEAGKSLSPCSSPTALSRTHTGALAPVSAPGGKAVCSRPDKPSWPVCPAQRAEKGNERGDRLIKEKEDMSLLCLPREAPVQCPSHPHRILMLFICSLHAACWRHSWWQTLSPGDAFPLGGRSCSLCLSRFYRNTDQQCKHQLFLPGSQIRGV